MAWTDKILKKMKSYYDKGLSTSEIGAKLGFSKNAIVGKINRLGWNTQKDTNNVEKAKKTDTKEKKTKKNDAKTVLKSKKKTSVAKEKKKKLTPQEIAIQHALALSNLKSDQCRWPINDPKSEDFHFCGEKTFPGKPYCFEHCLEAYSLNKPSDLKKHG